MEMAMATPVSQGKKENENFRFEKGGIRLVDRWYYTHLFSRFYFSSFVVIFPPAFFVSVSQDKSMGMGGAWTYQIPETSMYLSTRFDATRICIYISSYILSMSHPIQSLSSRCERCKSGTLTSPVRAKTLPAVLRHIACGSQRDGPLSPHWWYCTYLVASTLHLDDRPSLTLDGNGD